MSQGSASSTAAISSTFSGMKNGENTPTAISLASAGMWARMGAAMMSISRLGPGQMASSTVAAIRP